MKSILTHGGNSINSILESIILLQINFKIIESHLKDTYLDFKTTREATIFIKFCHLITDSQAIVGQ